MAITSKKKTVPKKKKATKKKTVAQKKKAAQRKRAVQKKARDSANAGTGVVDLGGRPTKYDDSICDELIKYMEEYEAFFDLPVEEKSGKNDSGEAVTVTKMKRVIGRPPSLVYFAHKIAKVSRSTLYLWAENNKRFSDTIAAYKEMFEDTLVWQGLIGGYSAQFANNVAKNRLGWTDRTDLTSKGERIKDTPPPSPASSMNNDELAEAIAKKLKTRCGPPSVLD